MSIILLTPATTIGCEPAATSKRDEAFVPADFVVPIRLEHPMFSLRPIRQSDAERDYAAVVDSANRLRARFGPEWPTAEFTLENNRAHLAIHEQQFAERTAFVYLILSPDSSTSLGCVYVTPDDSDQTDAIVVFWLRGNSVDEPFQVLLENELKTWINDQWPFQTVRFDGP